MWLIFFISKRFLLTKRQEKLISSIALVSTIGVALGVIVLNIALSVLNGFEREIQNRLTAFNLHIDLQSYNNLPIPFTQNIKSQIHKTLGNELVGITPYAGQLALVKFGKYKEGVYLKGILPEEDFSQLRQNIIEGEYNLSFDNKIPSIIIGKRLAKKLGLKLNDQLIAISLQSFVLPLHFENIHIEKLQVVGIYDSGISEFDETYAFIHLKTAQQLFGFGEEITGYEIKLSNPQRANILAESLTQILGYPFYAKSIFESYRNIFSWIELQKKPIPIVLALITIVAIFNIVSTLLILILEKTNSIGVLRSIGSTRKMIQIIFLIAGGFIGIVGTILGDIVSYFLLLLQIKFEIIKIPEGIYFLDKVPIAIEFNSFLLVSVLSITLSFIFSYIPARYASKIEIIKTIRFT